MVQMELTRILISETSDHQVIVLREKGGKRSFPIVIGIYEATAIDRSVKEIQTPRPLTHDLLGNIIRELGGELQRVVVNDLRDNTFFAKLIIQQNGKIVEVDSRPSDAIALAVQKGTPILVAEKVLDEICRSDAAETM